MSTLRVVAAAGLLVSAYVHLDLAPAYDSVGTVVTQGILFRAEAVAATVAAVLLLQFDGRPAHVAALAVAGTSALAVLVYSVVDVGALGPLPDMGEPLWYPAKIVSALASTIAAAAAGRSLLANRTHQVPVRA